MMDILIVENDAIVIRVWSKQLSKHHKVRSAESVVAAKKEIDKKLPDVILLDIRLNGPSNSGLNIYDFIRQDLNKSIPIIFITGLAYNVDLYKRAIELAKTDRDLGVFTHLMEKPVGINELSEVIHSLAA